MLGLGEVGWSGVDWIGLAQDKDKWRAHVNAVMDLQVPENARKRVATQPVASRVSAQLRRGS
jgi:hypothetical protein